MNAQGARLRAIVDGMRAIRLLLRSPMRIEDLAAELDMGVRSAHRLVVALRDAGIKLDRSPEGRIVLWRVRRESVERALGL